MRLDTTSANTPIRLAMIAIGLIAYMLSDLVHEVLGHGGASLLFGNKITLLTSVYYRTKPHSFVADACGPGANLIAALLCWAILWKMRRMSPLDWMFFFLTCAFNIFWFAWECLYAGVVNTGDFAFYIPNPAGALTWRIFLVAASFCIYGLAISQIASAISRQYNRSLFADRRQFRRAVLIAYLAACIGALIAVSSSVPGYIDSYKEAFMFPVFLPVLFISRRVNNSVSSDRTRRNAALSIFFIGIFLFVLFCLTLGRGIVTTRALASYY